jgi:chemotaxis regulatin CheY-phosphate phosphatase CheZ
MKMQATTDDGKVFVDANELDSLRAEVASLKEDLQRAIKQRDMWDKANSEAREQLAAANGRVEMLANVIKRAIELRVALWRNGDPDDDMMSDDQIIAKDHYASKWQAAISNLNEDRDKSDV